MNVRRSFVQAVALTVVVAMPLLGLSGVASAKATASAKKGSTAWCAKHKKAAACKTGGGSSTGGSSPEITVDASNAPVIQIEANPAFAGDTVDVESTQLEASCGGTVVFLSVQSGMLEPAYDVFGAILDDDGNATFIMEGAGNCAPGVNVVDASLVQAPYYTALGDYTNYPDVVTPPGVFGFPDPEVETGDSSTSGDSDVYAAFAIEAPPVYAEQTAEISDTQLESSCGGGYYWFDGFGDMPGTGTSWFEPAVVAPTAQATTAPTQTPLDDDGNGGVLFIGISCAATTSTVIGDVIAGDHPTYTGSLTVLPPQPTI
jgi:hypothetical protein